MSAGRRLTALAVYLALASLALLGASGPSSAPRVALDAPIIPIITLRSESRPPIQPKARPGAQPVARAEAPLEAQPEIQPVARPNPYDRGNCYQWKGCKGESIGSMPVEDPEFCGPLGGKSWKDFDGRCLDLKQGPRSSEPPEGLEPPPK